MNYSFVFLFLVLELAGSMPVQKHVIEQRRAKPRLDKPMDLEELDRQVIFKSYIAYYCFDVVRSLLINCPLTCSVKFMDGGPVNKRQWI